MANDVNGKIDDEINARLKKIMEQRNIYNETKVEGKAENLDVYIEAAKHINSYIAETGFKSDVKETDYSDIYDVFKQKFGPEALAQLSDDKLLSYIFYTSEPTNDSLCYNLEFEQSIRKYCGSTAGGSSYKFGLFQRKDDKVWISGSPNNPTELSDDDALAKGKEIRDILLKGCQVISTSSLDYVGDYQTLDTKLNEAIGKYASFGWVHKYFHMIYPDKFSVWHSTDWQNHILYAYGIIPDDKYYARSGQLSIISSYAKLSNATFGQASYDRFGDIRQFYRIGTSDNEGSYFSEWFHDAIVAIGWNGIGDLSDYLQGSDINKKALLDKMVELYYKNDNKTASRKTNELINFYITNANSIFVAMNGEELLALGDNVGTYFYSSENNMAHCKSIDWHRCFNKGEKLPIKTEGLLTSCVGLTKQENLLYLYHKYLYDMSDSGEEDIEENKKMDDIVRRVPRTDKQHALNQIIYGAPGTGKTYSSIEYALAIIEKRALNLKQTSEEERKELMEKYESQVDKGNIVFTTFHQSYGYEEFIQGLRPDTSKPTISFKVVDGVFKNIAKRAMNDQDENYVIIIDEINRGNISKIFGELITLIEEDKRWGEINQMSANLPLGGRFAVPNNLYIIGTMNSADKSISLIDTALRRRFDFVEMAPTLSIIQDAKLREVLKGLNEYLKKELRSTDLLVGHSYFIGKSIAELDMIMNRNIIPLLYEYFYDDEAKVKKALDCISNSDFEIDKNTANRIKIKKKDS